MESEAARRVRTLSALDARCDRRVRDVLEIMPETLEQTLQHAPPWVAAYLRSTLVRAYLEEGRALGDVPLPMVDGGWETQLHVLGMRWGHADVSGRRKLAQSIDRVVFGWWGLSLQERLDVGEVLRKERRSFGALWPVRGSVIDTYLTFHYLAPSVQKNGTR